MAGVPLLEAFPAPPSFIPPSPSPSTPLSFNPPPSRPPATPLPPVPGPSRFSWQDANRLLSSREDSISNISMHDLPDDDDDDDEDANAITTTTRAAAAVHAKRASWRSTFSDRSVRPITLSQSTSSIPTERSGSPDIPDIISRTPRPRRSSSTTFSGRPTSTSRPPSSTRRRTSAPIGLPYDRSSTFTNSTWEEADFIDDYGELERQLEGEGSDSDSSLDLHTPLPHLMVKHGLLSPHSKLLPKSISMDSLTSDEGSDPRASLSSLHSKTSQSILKDSRDTPRRRVRHRDGKLLRGGIGLTTGLGWSDSEDEDAPSPLTRRISSLNLSRAGSDAGSEVDKSLRMVRSSTSSLASGWRSTMSSGYTMPRSRLSSSSSMSSFNPPRSRASSSSTSSSYNHPPVSLRGFDKFFQQQGPIEEGDVYRQSTLPASPTPRFVDKDKLLPSLPNPKTGSIRRPTKVQMRVDQRARMGAPSAPTSSLDRKHSQSSYNGAPKALKLPTSSRLASSNPHTIERPVPVPKVSLTGTGPRPRTGTGMVYRSSGIPL